MLTEAEKTTEIQRNIAKNSWEGKLQCLSCHSTDDFVVSNELYLFYCNKCKTGWGAQIGAAISVKEIQTEVDKLI